MCTPHIEPCLPIPAENPPSGPDWVHEIKHDGYRLMRAKFSRPSGEWKDEDYDVLSDGR